MKSKFLSLWPAVRALVDAGELLGVGLELQNGDLHRF